MNAEDSVQKNNETFFIKELLNVIYGRKWRIALVTIIITAAAVFYVLHLPNTYKSEAILIPAFDSGGPNIPSQLGGLAALAGVNLGGNTSDKTSLALEIIRSRQFLGKLIEDNDLYIPIMAAKGWDRSKDKLLIDNDIYDEEKRQWVREVDEPFKPKPSVFETITEFKKKFSISQDKITGIVNLSVEHYSPLIAKQLVDKLILQINEDMRSRDTEEAEKSIKYLNEQIEKTNLADVKSVLFSLVEEQTKTKMLANVRNEYAFKTIDSAIVPELKSGPKRFLIVFLAFFISLVASITFVIVRHISIRC